MKMSEKEKICPVMSMPTSRIRRGFFGIAFHEKEGEYAELYEDFVPCQKEKCMAWIRNQSLSDPYCTGYCKLIDGRG
jgi:hypothetical protein